MRGLLVCSIVALLAVPVFGQGESIFDGTMDLTTAGAADMGTHWEIAAGDLADIGGGMFYLDIELSSTDAAGMASFGITLDSNPTKLAYGAVTNNDYTGYYSNYSTRFYGFGPGPRNGWDNLNAAGLAAGTMPMPGPLANGEVGTINQQDNLPTYTFEYAVAGLGGWVSVEIPDGSTTVTIGPAAGETPYVGDHDFQTMDTAFGNLNVKPLVITPEPVSALLLLLGLPLLRRRR